MSSFSFVREEKHDLEMSFHPNLLLVFHRPTDAAGRPKRLFFSARQSQTCDHAYFSQGDALCRYVAPQKTTDLLIIMPKFGIMGSEGLTAVAERTDSMTELVGTPKVGMRAKYEQSATNSHCPNRRFRVGASEHEHNTT